MLVLAIAATAAVAPAAAQAHHVAGGGAQCTLVGNIPTMTAWATFEGFQQSNKPVDGALKVDGATVETIDGFTFTGPSGAWQSAKHRATPGQHHISGAFWWPNQDGKNGKFEADVTCPTPPRAPAPQPPPPPATGHPSPPAPAPVAAPITAPPAQGGVAGATSSGPCVRGKLGRYRITVAPKHALHGLVRFHLHGPRVSRVRWYVDTRRAGLSGKRWEFIRRHGRTYGVYLWAQERWGVHLWGRHTIEARFRVKDACGATRAARVQRLYFNHDPRPDDPIFAHPVH
jgi:hypothetical protein